MAPISDLTSADKHRPVDRKAAWAIYGRALGALHGRVPFLVGGGFAMEHYLDAPRAIKDLDVFVCPADARHALDVLERAGFRTGILDPTWLGKAFLGELYVDVIFATRNGLIEVDERSFRGAEKSTLFGVEVSLQPIEELIASKAFVVARDRFDVSDVCHLFLRRGAGLDWRRLLDRLSDHHELLRLYLLFFNYIYPGRRDVVPQWVLDEVEQSTRSSHGTWTPENAFRGLLIDPDTFGMDVEHWGFEPLEDKPPPAIEAVAPSERNETPPDSGETEQVTAPAEAKLESLGERAHEGRRGRGSARRPLRSP